MKHIKALLMILVMLSVTGMILVMLSVTGMANALLYVMEEEGCAIHSAGELENGDLTSANAPMIVKCTTCNTNGSALKHRYAYSRIGGIDYTSVFYTCMNTRCSKYGDKLGYISGEYLTWATATNDHLEAVTGFVHKCTSCNRADSNSEIGIHYTGRHYMSIYFTCKNVHCTEYDGQSIVDLLPVP